MTQAQTQIADLMGAESDLGNPVFTYNNTQYVCLPSVSQATEQLQEGGFSVDRVLSITVRQSLFVSFPLLQDTLTYKGDRYRILSVNKDVLDTFLRLICVSDSRGV